MTDRQTDRRIRRQEGGKREEGGKKKGREEQTHVPQKGGQERDMDMDMVYKHNKYNKDNNSNNKRKHGQGRELFYAPSKGVCVLFLLFVDVVGVLSVLVLVLVLVLIWAMVLMWAMVLFMYAWIMEVDTIVVCCCASVFAANITPSNVLMLCVVVIKTILSCQPTLRPRKPTPLLPDSRPLQLPNSPTLQLPNPISLLGRVYNDFYVYVFLESVVVCINKIKNKYSTNN